jgi:prevent-host-death family protein
MKSTSIGAFAAKTHFSDLLEKVRHGARFTVTKHGRPVACLSPAETGSRRPVFGSDRGRVHMEVDFDAPLPDLADYEK